MGSSPAKNQNKEPVPPANTEKTSRQTWLARAAWIILGFFLGLVSLSILRDPTSSSPSKQDYSSRQPEHDPRSVKTQYNPNELAEDVEFHRRKIGTRLNRRRIDAAYENRQLSGQDHESWQGLASEPDMLDGLPLEGEPHHRQSSRNRSERLSPLYPDAQVLYELYNAELESELENRARSQFIEEFISNADAAGVEVQISPTYEVKARRKPNSVGSGSGQVR